MEDLWCFNDERVARAIAASQIPVISAVGHEPDYTIADFAADLRAATPSNGAELAVPDFSELKGQLSAYEGIMYKTVTEQIGRAWQRVRMLASSGAMTDPMKQIENRQMLLDSLQSRLESSALNMLGGHRQRYVALASKLDAISPLKVLARGYTMAVADDGKVVASAQQVQTGDKLKLRFADGTVPVTVSGELIKE